MPHYDELYPGRFLKGATLTAPRTIRIVSMGGERLQSDDGDRAKGILKYRDATGEGEIVLCRTNAILIAKALGTNDTDGWAGRLITIHFDKGVMFGKDTVGGIRIYGSPELKEPRKVEIKRPRRRSPEVYVLRPTDKNGREVGSAPAPESGAGG